jgi:hypothetical protein
MAAFPPPPSSLYCEFGLPYCFTSGGGVGAGRRTLLCIEIATRSRTFRPLRNRSQEDKRGLVWFLSMKKPGYLSRYSDRVWARRPGFESRQEQDFSLLHNVKTGSGARPASYPMGTGDSSPRVKRLGRDTDHTSHIKFRGREWLSCISATSYVFMA